MPGDQVMVKAFVMSNSSTMQKSAVTRKVMVLSTNGSDLFKTKLDLHLFKCMKMATLEFY